MHQVSRRTQTAYEAGQVASILGSAGIDIVSEVPSDYIIYCPFHNNSRTPAGEVSKETGVFFCFGCNKACDLTELIMHVTGKSYFQSMRIIGSQQLDVETIIKKMDKKDELEPFPQETIDRLHDCLDQRALEYFHSRGITATEEFELGYSFLRDMVVVPVHAPNGMPVGFVGRSVEGKDFKNSSGLPKRNVLFNLHRVRSSPYVYVMESTFDAIRCHQLGIPAIATFGSSVTKEQVELVFKYFPEVYVVPDRDDAGRKMALTLMNKGATLIPVPEGFNDIGDLTDDQIKDLLDRSNPLAGIW